MHFVGNIEECNMHKAVLKLVEISTKNVREDDLNPILWYNMEILENWHKTCTRGILGDRGF